MYVSLMSPELFKTFSQNLCIAENQTSYENFKLKLCTCAQSMALGTRTNFSLKFSPYIGFLALNIFAILFWRACKTLVKQPPGSFCSQGINSHDIDNVRRACHFFFEGHISSESIKPILQQFKSSLLLSTWGITWNIANPLPKFGGRIPDINGL